MSIFDQFFRDEPQVDLRALHGQARKYLEWAKSEETERLLERLETESGRPLKIGEQTALVEGAVRANTLREVASWLRQGIETAKADVESCERELKNV